MKGECVSEGEPEIEEKALRGELTWIDHPIDKRNESKRGLPRDIVLTSKLTGLFDQCFNAGLHSAEARPTMAELDRRYIDRVLQRTGGNTSSAAAVLGVDRRTLQRLFASRADET